MKAETVEMIRWFARVAEREYPPVPGTLAMLDLQRIRTDRGYGLKCYLTYLGTRAAAAPGYVPGRVKAVSNRSRRGGSFPELFSSFYHVLPYVKRNPMWDEQLAGLDVPACVELVQRGELSSAFAKLKVRGAGHKITAISARSCGLH